jgi:ABC-2 type transport system ATP-binding protein
LDLKRLPDVVTALAPLLSRGFDRSSIAGADRIAVPAPDGARTLAEALRRLDFAGIELVDIALRRPSLDDVFLSLTGHISDPAADAEAQRQAVAS